MLTLRASRGFSGRSRIEAQALATDRLRRTSAVDEEQASRVPPPSLALVARSDSPLCASRTASRTASVREMSSGQGGRRSATIGGMAESDDPSRDPDVPPPPKLPEVESPPPEDVLDEVPPKEEVVKRARPADEIVEEQPSVEELLDRDR